jgi:hypothetical protein
VKKLLFILLLCVLPSLVRAQAKGSLTAQDSGTCSTPNACVTMSVATNGGGATFTLSGTFSATVQFEASTDTPAQTPSNWVSLNVTPSNSTTAVTSATAPGIWQANVAGYTWVRIRVSLYTSGTVTAGIQLSTASARAGGGGSGLPAGQIPYGTGGGMAQAQTVTTTPNITTLVTGTFVTWLPVAANTAAAPTLAAGTTAATAITKCGTVALVAGDLLSTVWAVAQYDGTEWVLQNPVQFGCSEGGFPATGGTANAQTLAVTPAITAYSAGMVFNFTPLANTGAVTLAVSGLTPKAVTKFGNIALVANDLTTSIAAVVVYDGTEFQLLNPQAVYNTQGASAFFVAYGQGSTSASTSPCNAANTRCVQAPAAVTSTVETLAGITAQGTSIQTGNSSAITDAYSGDANHSKTVSWSTATSIGSTSLCSTANCPSGVYRVNAYIDVTTVCTTTGSYIINLIFTDDQGSKTVPINLSGTGVTPSTGALVPISLADFGQDAFILRSTGGASINYSTTAAACGSGGPGLGTFYLSVEPIQ